MGVVRDSPGEWVGGGDWLCGRGVMTKVGAVNGSTSEGRVRDTCGAEPWGHATPPSVRGAHARGGGHKNSGGLWGVGVGWGGPGSLKTPLGRGPAPPIGGRAAEAEGRGGGGGACAWAAEGGPSERRRPPSGTPRGSGGPRPSERRGLRGPHHDAAAVHEHDHIARLDLDLRREPMRLLDDGDGHGRRRRVGGGRPLNTGVRGGGGGGALEGGGGSSPRGMHWKEGVWHKVLVVGYVSLWRRLLASRP